MARIAKETPQEDAPRIQIEQIIGLRNPCSGSVPRAAFLRPISDILFSPRTPHASGRSHREDRLERGIRLDNAALVQALRVSTLRNPFADEVSLLCSALFGSNLRRVSSTPFCTGIGEKKRRTFFLM